MWVRRLQQGQKPTFARCASSDSFASRPLVACPSRRTSRGLGASQLWKARKGDWLPAMAYPSRASALMDAG